MTKRPTSQHASVSCPPRWATPRDPKRETHGHLVAEVAARLGTPLMPWQSQVADVALEIDPQTGLLAYREVVLTVPRQAGKTTLLLSLAVQRALGPYRRHAELLGKTGRQRIVYTAQSRIEARQKWEDEHVATLQRSIFKPMIKVRKTNGNEAIIWPKTGAMHGISSTTEKAGHGKTLDLAFVDEAFAHTDTRVDQSFRPPMLTRPQPQMWVVSTAGTHESVYLRTKVDAGRARVDAGRRSRIAYFEWSALEGSDPEDPATWWSCHPALGFTVTEDALRAELEGMPDPADFARSYLNLWPEGKADTTVIDPADWKAGAVDAQRDDFDPELEALPEWAPVAIAIDMSPDRGWCSVAIAGAREDGQLYTEIVEHRGGTGWVVDFVAGLHAHWSVEAVALDPRSPAGSLITDLEALGITITSPTPQEMGQACGQFYDLVATRRLAHLASAPLDDAVTGARKRKRGDAWEWDRKDTSVLLCPLIAATTALWAYARIAALSASVFVFEDLDEDDDDLDDLDDDELEETA